MRMSLKAIQKLLTSSVTTFVILGSNSDIGSAANQEDIPAITCEQLMKNLLVPAGQLQETALTHLALSMLMGVDPLEVLQGKYKFPGPISTREQASQLLKNEIYRNPMETISNQLTIIGDPTAKKRHVQVFPAEFRMFPISFFSRDLNDNSLGIPRDAQLFSMILKPEERRKYLSNYLVNDLEELEGLHLGGAFGYLRFYVRGLDVVVTEIQSDHYSKIRNPEFRKRYEHWSRELLLAFELYINENYFKKKNIVKGRIILAGEDYQLRRWPSKILAQEEDLKLEVPGIDAGLTRIIYRDLPALLGYRQVDQIDYAIEWPGHMKEKSDRLTPLVIGKGWVLDISTMSSNLPHIRKAFYQALVPAPLDKFEKVFDHYKAALGK